MRVDYGNEGLELNLNPKWNVSIIRPENQMELENPVEAIKDAIQDPINSIALSQIIQMKTKLKKVCIVIDDATRPVPSHFLLEALTDLLHTYGVPSSKIIILIANGLHRKSTKKELKRMIGNKLYGKIEVLNHNPTDKQMLSYIGTTMDQIPICLNKHYCESDLKIITGYVEPHFFFGFSGGAKSIVPGIAGEETIQLNHSAENIASPYSRFGIYEKNPMASISNEIASIVGVDFTVNVCINEKHKITKAAAGDLHGVHEKLVNYQLKNIFTEIPNYFDIVVCGNGGYPLDLNLYQAVKSMAIGEMAVKDRGTIISVNECSDGLGIGQDQFKALLFSDLAPEQLYEKIMRQEIVVPDQWEIQILARVMMRAEVYLISRLKESEIGNIGLKYAINIEEAISAALKKHGRNARILLLPNGPQILPIKKDKK